MRKNRQLGQILVELGYITQEQLVHAVMEQKDTGERLGSILTRWGYVTNEQLTEALALQSGMEYIRFTIADVQPEAVGEIAPAIARRLQVLPLRMENGKMLVAPLDINNSASIQELYRVVPKPLRLVCANPAMIEAALRLYYPEDAGDVELAAEYPCVREFVDSLLNDAISQGAEAVHLESYDRHAVVVCYRVGGRLQTVRTVPNAYARVATHRLKKLTGMLPQMPQAHFSGILQVERGNEATSAQLSCVHTSRGERAVIRFLRTAPADAIMDGLSADAADAFQRMLASRSGLFVVSGDDLGACQVVLRAALQRKTGEGVSAFSLDWAAAQGLSDVCFVDAEAYAPGSIKPIHAVLAQDPDVVIAGMVQSAQQMQVLVSAAGAGVWVALAVPSADVIGAIEYMRHLGVAPTGIATTLLGVIQVHTIPQLCEACRVAQTVSLAEWLTEEPREALIHEARGCDRCRHTGFSGTVSVIEALDVDGELRDLLLRRAEDTDIRQAVSERLRSALRDTLRQKVLSGQIALAHAQLLWDRQYPPAGQFLALAA